MSNAKFVPSRLFSLALMPRLGIAHPLLPKQLLCPGCRILLDSKAMLAHIPGCSKCPGLNATAKHNSLVNFLYELCLKAGIPCEKEPRNFATFSCTQCNEKVDPDYRRTHGKVCGGRSFRRSGPDLVVFWNSGEIFYDFTVIHELAPSNLGTKCGKLFRDAIKRKQDTYVRSGLISEETFRCVPVLSGGSLHENTKSLLNALADACCLPAVPCCIIFYFYLMGMFTRSRAKETGVAPVVEPLPANRRKKKSIGQPAPPLAPPPAPSPAPPPTTPPPSPPAQPSFTAPPCATSPPLPASMVTTPLPPRVATSPNAPPPPLPLPLSPPSSPIHSQASSPQSLETPLNDTPKHAHVG